MTNYDCFLRPSFTLRYLTPYAPGLFLLATLLVRSLNPAWSSPNLSASLAARLAALVLALDGASFDVIEPLIKEGRLPHLSAWMKEGHAQKLPFTATQQRSTRTSDRQQTPSSVNGRQPPHRPSTDARICQRRRRTVNRPHPCVGQRARRVIRQQTPPSLLPRASVNRPPRCGARRRSWARARIFQRFPHGGPRLRRRRPRRPSSRGAEGVHAAHERGVRPQTGPMS